jgi:hypothetical protein
MRFGLLLAPLAVVAGCAGSPSAEDIADRWPDAVGVITPGEQPAADVYEERFLEHLDGADAIALYTLDDDEVARGYGLKAVQIITSANGFSADEVNQMRCEIVGMIGVVPEGDDDVSDDRLYDAYGGEDGLHGSGGVFIVDVDGAAVFVASSLTEDQAHQVARALGGVDEVATKPCDMEMAPLSRRS